jgi:branched-chain amino acid transport system ATP-binding protein
MLLRVEKVTKSFDGFVAVQDVELTVAQGQMACIIGPNGAGKSTIFNLITGHLQPTRGKFFFRDRDNTGLPPYTICQLGMGAVVSAYQHLPASVRFRQHPGSGTGASQENAQLLYTL